MNSIQGTANSTAVQKNTSFQATRQKTVDWLIGRPRDDDDGGGV